MCGGRLAWTRTPAFQAGDPGFKSRPPHQGIFNKRCTSVENEGRSERVPYLIKVSLAGVFLVVVSLIVLIVFSPKINRLEGFNVIDVAGERGLLGFTMILVLAISYALTPFSPETVQPVIDAALILLIVYFYADIMATISRGAWLASVYPFIIILESIARNGMHVSVALFDWGQLAVIILVYRHRMFLLKLVKKKLRGNGFEQTED